MIQILRDGVGLKPGRLSPIHAALISRDGHVESANHYITSFKPFSLGKRAMSALPLETGDSIVARKDEGDNGPDTCTTQDNFSIAATGPLVNTIIKPSVVYAFSRHIVFFGLPERRSSYEDAMKQPLPSDSAPSTSFGEILQQSSSASPEPKPIWKRAGSRFSLKKRSRTVHKDAIKRPVSSVSYQVFEVTKQRSSIPFVTQQVQDPSQGVFEFPPSPYETLKSTSIHIGRLVIEGGEELEAQQMREWCLISGRMLGHGDNVESGAYTISGNPSAPIDVLYFR